jgi:hypothetical protein
VGRIHNNLMKLGGKIQEKNNLQILRVKILLLKIEYPNSPNNIKFL